MSGFKKDYRTLYEATKLDLQDQVSETAGLRQDIENGEKLDRQIELDRRERIATEVHRQGWQISTADQIYAWVSGEKSKLQLPTKVVKKPKKRTYKKKSKFWGKKKK